MTRLVLTAGVVLTAVVVLAAAVGVLAYGTEPTRTGTLSIEGLSEDVTLAWDDSGRVWVEGPAEVALATGLGYAHAVDHGWPASLWRRAATGTLAEWFGEEARALDIHARTLGFRALARRTYETLDAERRQVLDAYARGATAGFSEPGVVQSNPFIVVGAVPDAWQPWDALAIERLHIYLSAPALASDTSWQRAAATDSVVSEFVAADSSFRAFLGATGGGFDRAYTTDADTVSGQATLVHQVSAGSSALPHLAPAVLRSPAGVATALTIPGTLASPSGWSGGIAWALLSGSRLEIERYGGTRPPPVFSRIVERDGDETLLEVARDTSGLVLRAGAAPGAAPDTTASASGWRVRWRGFRVGTDLPAFSALRSGQPPPGFVLLDGTGMTVDSDARVIGAPRVARRRGAVTFAARDSLAGWSVDLLATGTTRRDSVRAIASVAPADVEIASGWARQRLPRMMAALGVRDSLPDLLQTSYAYLNGWDGAYRADGIAPSIFEWWLRSHRDLTGGLPDLSDSLDVALLPSSLRIARAELRDRYGTVPSDWRWGNVQGGPAYPVLASRRSPAARPFQMALAPPGGHPTAARPGPSIVFEGAQPGRAVWTIRIDTRTGVTSVRSPSMRTDVDDGLDLQADPGGPRLILDPRAPVPADLLTLTPAS